MKSRTHETQHTQSCPNIPNFAATIPRHPFQHDPFDDMEEIVADLGQYHCLLLKTRWKFRQEDILQRTNDTIEQQNASPEEQTTHLDAYSNLRLLGHAYWYEQSRCPRMLWTFQEWFHCRKHSTFTREATQLKMELAIKLGDIKPVDFVYLAVLYIQHDVNVRAEEMYLWALRGLEKAWGVEQASTLDTFICPAVTCT